MDLSNNRLSRLVSKCLDNITTKSIDAELDNIYDWDYIIVEVLLQPETISLYVKGQELDYEDKFRLVCIVNLSNNALSGSIPSTIFNLTALQSLNLSNNYLIGKILTNIGHMNNLDSLWVSSLHQVMETCLFSTSQCL